MHVNTRYINSTRGTSIFKDHYVLSLTLTDLQSLPRPWKGTIKLKDFQAVRRTAWTPLWTSQQIEGLAHLFVFLRYVLFGKLGQLHHLRHHLSLVIAVGQVDQHGDAGVGHVALGVLPTHPKPRSCNRTSDKMTAKLLVVEIFQTSKWLLVRRNLQDIKMTSC